MKLLYTSYLVAVLAMLTPFVSKAQNLDSATLVWKSNRAINQLDNNAKEHVSSFRTIRREAVEWIQKDGESVYRYTITDKHGNWSSVDQDGTVTYDLALSDVNGKLIIKKENGMTTIRLRTRTGSSYDLDYIFEISSITEE